MEKSDEQVLLVNKSRGSRRTFFKQAGSLLVAGSSSGLAMLGGNTIALAAGSEAMVRNTQEKVLGWQGWEDLNGILSSKPCVASWATGRLDVFARGLDTALWHKWYNNGWSGWESLGGGLTSGPGAVSWSNGRIDVFAVGRDSALWHKWYDNGWSGWENLGGGPHL